VVVLGSTGSVGTQAIDIVSRNPESFRIVGLAAGGGRADLLARQALDLGVDVVALSASTALEDLQLALYADAQRRGWSRGEVALPKVLAGPDAVEQVAAWPCDVVLNAITGSVGLPATLAAIEAGRTLALANKESLIAGGPIVTRLAAPGQIVPVDSEHSAIAQCLRAGSSGEVRRLVLTASGGPFRGRRREELAAVTAEQALAHPTWSMGPVVTLNSATLMNKALEVIEAHWLFRVPFDQIDVVVHPQSMIHSMVEFTDGATIAQASPPDMRLPISLGLGWPDRVTDAAPGCDWTVGSQWTFEPLDTVTFPAVDLAREAGRSGGTAPAVLNAANEVCVDAFLAGRIAFLDIVDTVAAVVGERDRSDDQIGLADVVAAEQWARARAGELLSVVGAR
jgi:1-deoxy-D-xylulose-5-phosphate reductoisomerase